MELLLLIAAMLFYGMGYSQVQNEGTIRLHPETQIGFFGDVTNNGTFDCDSGRVVFSGNQPQLVNGSNLITIGVLSMEKSASALDLDIEIAVSDSVVFTTGEIRTDLVDSQTVFLHFLDDAVATGASNSSFVNGVVRKTGNDGFEFPVGNNGFFRPISMGAPSLTSDHFSAYYRGVSPNPLFSINSLDGVLDHVSDCEYWGLHRTNGTSDVDVTLSWAANSCGVDALCDLQIAGWRNNQWETLGNGGTTGTVISGTLITGTGCSTPEVSTHYGEFTLASLTAQNPLPVELIGFTAMLEDDDVRLTWSTHTEFNSDHFALFRSDDLENWEYITNVDAAGYSTVPLSYNYSDEVPFRGVRYYLLKAVDLDGTVSAQMIDKVTRGFSSEYSFYPNPTSDILVVTANNKISELEIFDAMGRNCTEMVEVMQKGESILHVNLQGLSTGIYTVRIDNVSQKIEKR